MKVCPRCSEVYGDATERCPADDEALMGASDPLIGRMIGGRYRLVDRLGTGGMSSVYLARHVLIDRSVAVKILRRDLAEDPVQRDRFIREARAVNRVNHENIVEITDFGETEDGLVYLVMEHVPGEPLYVVMGRETFSSTRALHIAEQIAEALGRAHQMGVIHRDLKPENLLVVPGKGREDFIKVLDFGIAKILDAPSLTGSQQIFGTPGYIAPEYIESTNIDGRADLYSLGVILYELVTGALPFDYEYPGDLLVKHVTEAPIPPRVRRPGVEKPMEALILRCLEKNPDRRFRDAYHFLEALRATRERLGGGDTWGGMQGGGRASPPKPLAPTPVMTPGRQGDLLRRAMPEGAPPPSRHGGAPSIPPPPLPGGVAATLAAAISGTGDAEVAIVPGEADGLVACRLWRRRLEALRSALGDIEAIEPLPEGVAQPMALASAQLDALEGAVAGAERNQAAMEALVAEGRRHRAEIGALTDPLSRERSVLEGELDRLARRRAALASDRSRRDELRELDGAVRLAVQKRDAVDERIEALHRQLERQSEPLEARVADLARAGNEEMAKLDGMASALRAPLEGVERYIRAFWDARRKGSVSGTPRH